MVIPLTKVVTDAQMPVEPGIGTLPTPTIDNVVVITAAANTQPVFAAELQNTEQRHYFSPETDLEIPFPVYVNSRPRSAKPLYSAPSSHNP
ncbi:MAG: hypothetical protein GY861_00650 [bacterium]|nr:hypothetical protein [bacterium]